jgi:hypothetical protein
MVKVDVTSSSHYQARMAIKYVQRTTMAIGIKIEHLIDFGPSFNCN